MKARSVMRGTSPVLRIRHFGTEDIPTQAKWGPGARNVYIFHYVLKGKGYFNGNLVEKNQGFLIRANEFVEYHFDESEPWQYFWVIFEGDSCEEICQKYIKADENGIFLFSFADELCALCARLFASSFSLSQTEALAVFFHLLSLHEERTLRRGNHYVSDAKNYMRLHIHQPITIEQVAMALGISDRYLYNLFIKHEGTSPKEYLSVVRLENAKALLSGSAYTVTEIAAAIGFPDVMTFSRFFAKREGISPSAYRKLTREKKQEK